MKSINLIGYNSKTGFGICAGNGGKAAGNIADRKQLESGSVFGGNMPGGIQDRVEQKRIQARKHATQVVMEQFSSDKEIADGMDKYRTKIEELKEEMKAIDKEKQYFTEEQEKLKESEGLMEEGEYQDRVKENDKWIKYYDSILDSMKSEIMEYSDAIKGTKTALLKSRGMIDAEAAAESIMQAASDEIIGMLTEEAQKHIDEKAEELEEAAEKASEKKEEQEERLDAVKSDKEQQEELVENIQDTVNEQNKLQQEVDKILKDANLLEEDIKGLMVDGSM